MPTGTTTLTSRPSAHDEADDHGWFSGDLADHLPTQTIPRIREPLRLAWAQPTPELLARLLDALRRL